MKKECISRNYDLFIYDIFEKEFFIEKEQKLLKYNEFFSRKNINIINLPNYDHLFELNPRFISTKNIGFYNEGLRQYIDPNLKKEDIKILGKIYYENKYISADIKDSNIAMLISGEIRFKEKSNEVKYIMKKNDKYKYILETRVKKKKIAIFKSLNINEIYEKNIEKNSTKVVKALEKKLINGHVILIKVDNKKLIGKKRKPESLFLENKN